MVGYKAFVKCICGTASLPEDITLQSGAGPDEDAVGFLHKRGGGKHATIWQQRLFVVKRSSMYYYKSRDDISPKGVIRLMGCSYYIVKAATDKKNHFRIKHPSFKTRELSTQTEDQLTLWEVVIQKAIADARENCEFCGWLFKKDKSGKRSWKRRYCVITSIDRKLRYYEDPDDLVEKGTVNLLGAKFEMKVDGKDKSKSLFSITTQQETRQFYTEAGLLECKRWQASVEKQAGAEAEAEAEGDENSNNKKNGNGSKAMAGYLHKKGGGTSIISRKNWKRRYVRYDNELRILSWYSSELSKSKLGEMTSHTTVPASDMGLGKYNHTFNVRGIEKGGKDRVMQFRAEDFEVMEMWLEKLNASNL